MNWRAKVEVTVVADTEKEARLRLGMMMLESYSWLVNYAELKPEGGKNETDESAQAEG